MFLVNSRPGLFTATPFSSSREGIHLLGAPLLPKLRGHFAEFLDQSYLEHLRIFSSPTCVRLRYGHLQVLPNEAFLGSVIRVSLWAKPSHSRLGVLASRICLRGPPTRLEHVFQHVPDLSLLRPPTASGPKTSDLSVVREYSTRFPSATPFGLALGAG